MTHGLKIQNQFRPAIRIVGVLVLLLSISSVRDMAQAASGEASMVMRLEKKDGSIAKTVAQNTVFRTGDILRFRLTSKIAGYLYVVDQGTTGSTATLFPISSGASSNNSIAANVSTLVPATGDGWFEVSGPPGFDVIYILVSATPISLPPAASQPADQTPATTAPLPNGLIPRCDDSIFKARGECVDSSAGVAPLSPNAPLPRELSPLAKTASRDIILTDDGDGTQVKPGPAAKLPLIYTFRLAHLQ
jgi:hypothetical protein